MLPTSPLNLQIPADRLSSSLLKLGNLRSISARVPLKHLSVACPFLGGPYSWLISWGQKISHMLFELQEAFHGKLHSVHMQRFHQNHFLNWKQQIFGGNAGNSHVLLSMITSVQSRQIWKQFVYILVAYPAQTQIDGSFWQSKSSSFRQKPAILSLGWRLHCIDCSWMKIKTYVQPKASPTNRNRR